MLWVDVAIHCISICYLFLESLLVYPSGVTMEKSQPYFPPSCRMKFNNPSDAYLNECVLKRESTVIIVLGQTGRPIKCSTVNSKTKKPFKSHIPILHFLNTPCKCVLCKVGHGVRSWRQLQKHMNRFHMEINQSYYVSACCRHDVLHCFPVESKYDTYKYILTLRIVTPY